MSNLLRDHEYRVILPEILKEAEQSISICTFKAEMPSRATGKQLALMWEIMFKKHIQGINIRLLVNWHEDKHCVPKTNQRVMNELRKRNIEVKHLKNNRCCHAKILIVDKKIAVIGSHNMAVNSLCINFELSLIIEDRKIISEIQGIYDDIWGKAKMWR